MWHSYVAQQGLPCQSGGPSLNLSQKLGWTPAGMSLMHLDLCLKTGFKCPKSFSSVAQSCPTLWPYELQHARPPCPSPTPGVHSDSHPLSQWCHPAISSSIVPFSSCPQSLPASESFPMSQLFAWGGQRTGVSASASVLPKKSQGWSPSEWTGWISLQSKGLKRSSPTPQFKSINSSALSFLHIRHLKAIWEGKCYRGFQVLLPISIIIPYVKKRRKLTFANYFEISVLHTAMKFIARALWTPS